MPEPKVVEYFCSCCGCRVKSRDVRWPFEWPVARCEKAGKLVMVHRRTMAAREYVALVEAGQRLTARQKARELKANEEALEATRCRLFKVGDVVEQVGAPHMGHSVVTDLPYGGFVETKDDRHGTLLCAPREIRRVQS